MRKRCVWLLFAIFLFQPLLRAQTQPPSFRQQLAAAKSDTQRLNVYRDIYTYYKNSNSDTVRYFLEQALEAFTKSKYPYGRAAVLGMLSGGYSEQGMPLLATNAAKEALKIFTELGDENGIAKSHNALGVIDGRQGNFKTAIAHFLEALQYFERVGDTVNLINTYVKLGTANSFARNDDKALVYYQKGLVLSLKTNQIANTAHLYNNIGTYHAKRKAYDTALSYFNKALALSQDPRRIQTGIPALMNIGKLYAEKNELQKALSYYRRGLDIARSTGMKEEAAKLLHNMGEIESELMHGISPSLQEALELARSAGNRTLEADVLSDMAHISGDRGEYKEEVAYLRQAVRLRDSIFTVEKAKEIANLQAGYELDKSQSQLAALSLVLEKNMQKRNAIIVIAIVLAITLLTLMFFFVKGRKLNQQLLKRETELQRANDTKDRLFSIIGHDLRGPIANIPALLDVYKDKNTTDDERAYVLYSLEENSIASLETLEKLLNWGKLQIKGQTTNRVLAAVGDLMNNPLRLSQVSAAGKNISITNKVPPGLLVYTDEDHFRFIMRNLLSNAIKYTGRGGYVEVNAREHDEGYILFSVKDTGMGIDKSKQRKIFELQNESTTGTDNEKGTSIGLMLCKVFVQQNGGDIWVDSEPGQGATFYFTVKNGKQGQALTLPGGALAEAEI